MKLVSLRQANTKWMNALRAKNFESIILYTFKKDRSIRLEKTDEGFVLSEAGYLNQKVLLDPADAKKQLKDAFAREFPRSSRIYMQEGN